MKAVDRRPNVVQIIYPVLEAAIQPSSFLLIWSDIGKTYAAWYTAIENLQEVLDEVVDFNQDAQNVSHNENRHHPENSREVAGEALAQLYAELGETDIFYGPKNDNLDFPWDFLSDLARAEHNSELLLECQWRQADWSTEHESIELAITNLPSQSIRRNTFQAYLTLLKSHMGLLVDEHRSEFTRICDEGIQLCLHQWFRLPEIVTESHIPLLQAFQQFVELQEASQIFHSLTTTTSQNLEARSADLKHVLQTWRERLPNQWDDINIWSDLVAWRQHVFSAINRTYIPLIQSNLGANTQSFAYRGHHETAWMVNRFAHVARKHGLSQLCKDSLTRLHFAKYRDFRSLPQAV
ncbi:hypothetical protein PGTUg99_000125 [Puccinia graminis f. sp. tritici]|uniref:FAT domain-containing protein n=1 Tax=Puccinia graminis f. sp. tritici TaxID=56615 RepID=A0A5B0PUJ9_PUCGR|nr:hypothetical protein PGTUg99_000125 [Puccinia graminis f. sp. tritici]